MKKLIIVIIALLFAGKGFSQNCNSAIVTTEPATFTAEDEVKITLDVSGCPVLAAESDIYLWMFVPGGPGPDGVGGNGDFCNGSNPNMKMTNEGNNIHTFTFTPTELFDATPAEIGTQIGLLAKVFAACKTAGDQTTDIFLNVESLVFIETENRIFPSKFTADDVITLYFNQNLTEDAGMKALDEIYVYTAIQGKNANGEDLGWVEAAPWGEVGNLPEMKLENEGNGVFSITFIPNEFYPVNPGDKIERLNYKFRSKDGNTTLPGGFDNFISDVIILE